jgi:hypothetical protein
MTDSERFGLVFAKAGPIIQFGHWSLEIFTLDFRKSVFGTSKEVTSFTEYRSGVIYFTEYGSSSMGVIYFTEYGSME